MIRDVGLWSRELRARLIVVDPLGPLIEVDAMHVPLWRWWASRVGADPDEVVEVARTVPTRRTIERFARVDGVDLDVVRREIDARRATLVKVVRRARGALALLRDVPPRRIALWTCAEDAELELLAQRARLSLPTERLTGLGTEPSDDARARAFLSGLGGEDPETVVALEGGPAGVARSLRIGAQAVLVGAAAAPATLAPRAASMAAIGAVPTADGLAISVRKEPRLR
jgi:beta-phosphoglucomutase-like phosphatase (HAD superfamily)